jgi:OmpR-family two-component system manganese-sensing sensor histidine kinase
MFKNLRWRIALWFVGLSAVVYVTLTVLSLILFDAAMKNALDAELEVISSSLNRAVEVQDSKPVFKQWAKLVQGNPAKSLVTIQLYDQNGTLLESYGPNGYPHFLYGLNTASAGGSHLRVRSNPLISGGKKIGFLQLELRTTNVEASTKRFVITMIIIAPLVLFGLGATAMLVSGKVTAPVEQNHKMLRRFVEDASHELNTPLCLAQARADSLEKKLDGRGTAAELEDLRGAQQALLRMGRVINDLMLLTEVEGALSIKKPEQLVRLDELLRLVAAEFRDRFAGKQIVFTCDLDSPVLIRGFSDPLQRLASNLLENAFKYTPEAGNVWLSLKAYENFVEVQVKDSGEGIPKESVEHIFERFYRVDPSRARSSGGIGLGLSIVDAIATAHQGSVSVVSEPGSGSSFTVRLPI